MNKQELLTKWSDPIKVRSWVDVTGGIKIGCIAKGETRHLTKLTQAQALQILNGEISIHDAATQFDISVNTARDILKRRTWKHLQKSN